ncbi:MAG: trigger factor [Oscillospiraceae bacterium]|nr:trigger factor [Oscillospiraceae bacterium]
MILKNVEKKENNTAAFVVESDAAEFEKAVNDAYRKNRSSISIPGFRKGKAPRAVIEGMYGPEVFYQDAMDELAPGAYEFGLKESGLKTVGAPSISDVNITDDRAVTYTFSVSVYPKVTLGQYKGVEALKPSADVTDEDVEAELNATRKRNARMIDIDDRPARMGDTADIDFDGYLNGERFDGGKAEGHKLELGSNSFVPGFEDQVVGMKVGEEKDINITFPEDYVPELAGKDVVFKVKLNSLTMPELPELDDEFAKDVSEFDTLDEYKASIRENLAKTRAERAEAAFKDAVMFQAAENITADIPEVMIEEKEEDILRNYAGQFGLRDRSVSLDEIKKMMGINDEIMEKSIRPAALSQVKTDLLLDAVMEAEELADTDEAFEAYVSKTAAEVGATAEQLKQYFGEDFMRHEFRKELATNLIVDSAVAKAE